MPSLKDLRNRIDSVKSTKKITQAMKMVAASKLKKAQSLAEKGRSYSSGLEDIVKGLVKSGGGSDNPLLNNNDKISSSLIVIVSSDRGLCGGLNTNIVKATKNKIEELQKEGKSVSLICIGKKGYDLLSVNHEEKFNLDLNYKLIGEMDYRETQDVAEKLLEKIYKKDFQECYLFYNYFRSVISQEVKSDTLVPYSNRVTYEEDENKTKFFEYEPNEEDVLSKILPKNFIVQLFKAILESRASEQGARMTAMDNATRNAGDMIDSLSLKYNRQRQAIITKELIEIISGAEAL